MKKKAALIEFLKSTPTIIVTCLTMGGGAVAAIYSLVNEKAEAQAEVKAIQKYQEKYDKIATEYIMLSVKCGSSH